METEYAIEALYKFYTAGYETAANSSESHTLEMDNEQAREAYRIGLVHGRLNPKPPNIPASLNAFQNFFPAGNLEHYGRPNPRV